MTDAFNVAETLLYLGAVDVLPVGSNQHVFLAATDEHMFVSIYSSQVTRMQYAFVKRVNIKTVVALCYLRSRDK